MQRGSGNIGYANVRRIAGPGPGFMTLLGDVAKGAIPTLIALWVTESAVIAASAGILAVAGHLHSPWIRFRGGKGVATALGMTLILTPAAGLGGVITYAVLMRSGFQSSTASLVGIATTSVLAIIASPQLLLIYLSLCLLLVFKLRHNIVGTAPDHG